MFIDDHTHAAAREFLAPEVRALANRVLSEIRTHQGHPTFITKTDMRGTVTELKLAHSLLAKADGGRTGSDSAIDDGLSQLVSDAILAARDYGLGC